MRNFRVVSCPFLHSSPNVPAVKAFSFSIVRVMYSVHAISKPPALMRLGTPSEKSCGSAGTWCICRAAWAANGAARVGSDEVAEAVGRARARAADCLNLVRNIVVYVCVWLIELDRAKVVLRRDIEKATVGATFLVDRDRPLSEWSHIRPKLWGMGNSLAAWAAAVSWVGAKTVSPRTRE